MTATQDYAPTLGRIMAGVDATPVPANAWPTVGQFWHILLTSSQGTRERLLTEGLKLAEDDVRRLRDAVTAVRWWRNGDHPQDRVGKREIDTVALLDAHPEMLTPDGEVGPVPNDAPTYERAEGAVVRFFCHPDVSGDLECRRCARLMRDHGWIDSGRDGQTVCPGDFIVTTVAQDHLVAHAHVLPEDAMPVSLGGTVAACTTCGDSLDATPCCPTPDGKGAHTFAAGVEARERGAGL